MSELKLYFQKSTVLLLSIVLSFGLFGCSTPATAPSETEETSVTETPIEPETAETTELETLEAETIEPETEEAGIQLPIFPIEQLDVQFTVMDQVDELTGNMLAAITYENQSEYPVRRLEITTRSLEKDAEFDMTFHDTVMPGEVSIFTVGEVAEDIEAIYYRYIVYYEEQNYEITYDVLADKYDQMIDPYVDMDLVDNSEVLVSADELEISYVTDPPTEMGTVYSHVTVKNNSSHTLEQLFLNMINYDGQRKAIFGMSPDDRLAPGEEVTITSFGGEKLKPLDTTYVVIADDKQYIISHDFQLDPYEQFEDPTYKP